MPTPKNKFLDAVWERITKEREELALYRKRRGLPDDSEELPDEKKRPVSGANRQSHAIQHEEK